MRNEEAKNLGKKIQIASRQPRNLQRLVKSANFSEGGQAPPCNPGCFKCKKPCHACPTIVEGASFKSTNTKKVYKMKKGFNCDSKYIVYLATCKKCSGQYVGKSIRQFKRRHSGHKQEIKNKIGGLGHHYGRDGGCGYANFSVQIIDQVDEGDDESLADTELYWAHQLRCYIENGGGAHSFKKEKGLGRL